jgi:predicted dehydrogenase
MKQRTYVFMKYTVVLLLVLCNLLYFTTSLRAQAEKPLKVAVAGLSHDHVTGLLERYKNGEVVIVGIAESDTNLIRRYQERYELPATLFYKTLPALLKQHKPDAVLAYNAIADHLAVVQACAPAGIHVMVEKPLATTLADANKIVLLAQKHRIHVLTNYETTWYPSNQQLFTMLQSSPGLGEIRKMVTHDGHEGPKEIGVSNEFLQWLTDPVKNGGGAIIDFGCYGANLMTWLMKGAKPISVTALTRRIKPEIYPLVDDDATILLEYPQATGIIEASWNWPFSIKDLEVFGKAGYIQAVNNHSLRIRENGNNSYAHMEANTLPPEYQDNLSYLSAVISNRIKPGEDLSSLKNNLIVVEILEAARQSAQTGQKILLTK